MKTVGYLIGGALVAFGFGGLLTHAADTHPVGWVMWFAGFVVVHDFFFVPVVLALAALVVRLPAPYRNPVRTAGVLAGVVALVSVPLVSGFGKTAGNPSQLPLSYGRNLLLVLAGIALVTGAVVARRAWSARTRRRASRPGGGARG
ncbi:MAG TPA: hypothetical protein VFU43_09920 [Streptosporangiaceae bacterium]|nr:hypothetical protein [Streptosporangiaceae bacterium]